MEEPAVEAPGHPAVVRVRADNPGPMTLTGTNTYVVGSSPAWVIDPGPADPDHIDLVREVGETRGGIEGVLLTHSHSDHNAGVEMLGAPVLVGNESGFDDLAALLATEPVAMPPAPPDGAEVGPFRVIATPGHAPDHVAFVYGGGDLLLRRPRSSARAPRSSRRRPAAAPSPTTCARSTRSPRSARRCSAPATAPGSPTRRRRSPSTRTIGGSASGCWSRRSMRASVSDEDLLDAAWSDVPEPMRPAAALAMRAHLEKLEAEGRLPDDFEY